MRRGKPDWSSDGSKNGKTHRSADAQFERAGGVDQSRDQGGQRRQEPELLRAGGDWRPGRQSGGLRRGQSQGSAVGHSQRHRSGQEESAQDTYTGDHHSAPVAGPIRQRPGAAEAGSGRDRRDRRRTGVIAGGPVRAVITAAGIPNVLTKSIGTHNPHNVVKATIVALEQLRDKNEVAEMRGLAVEKL